MSGHGIAALTRRQLLTFGGLAVAAVGLAACSGGGGTADLRGEGTLIDLPFDSTAGVGDAARSSAALGWDLLVAGTDPNRVIAPSSLAITLGMLAEGATEETLTALDGAFGLAGDARSRALGALRQSLDEYDSLPESVDVDDPPESPVVHQASQVVILGDNEVEQQFLDRLAQYFDAAAQRVTHAEAKAVLDEWASTHTAGLIESSAIEVHPQLALVLQDAILFAAAWEREFGRDDVPLEFAGPDGPQQVGALGGTFSVPYAGTAAWRAVRLPYDDALVMDVILPTEGSAPSDLTAEQLEEVRVALDAAEPARVSVTMPPVDLRAKWSLLEPLGERGITFTNSLDGIFPGAEVSEFAQQVRLMTSAKGTVGAALTEVAVPTSAEDPDRVEQFTVDRPFAMRVLDIRTGWPFFLAIVTDAVAAIDSAP